MEQYRVYLTVQELIEKIDEVREWAAHPETMGVMAQWGSPSSYAFDILNQIERDLKDGSIVVQERK